MGILFLRMKYLVKTTDSGALETVEHVRVIWDSTDDNVLIQNTIGVVSSDYVDFGLPSGLLWAKKNLGAATEDDAGLYSQWGDTVGYTAEQVGVDKTFASDFSNYKYYSNGEFTKYNATDGKIVLDLEDDAVNMTMGGNWRIPTQENFHELINNTDLYLVPVEGAEIKGAVTTVGTTNYSIRFEWGQKPTGNIKGMKFCKKGDSSVYMFVPAVGVAVEGSVRLGEVGYLWSSSLLSNTAYGSWDFAFNTYDGGVNRNNRCYGLPLRGVCSK